MIRKESTAWLLLAELFDVEGRHEFLCHYLDGTNAGCWDAQERYPLALQFERTVSENTRRAMKKRIALDVNEGLLGDECGAAYKDTDEMTNNEEQQARVLACLMFAYEAKGEGR